MKGEEYKSVEESKAFFASAIKLIMDGKEKSFITLFEDFTGSYKEFSSGAIIKEFKSEGKTLVHIASASGKANILKYILEKCDSALDVVNASDLNGYTPLMNATNSGNVETIRLLLLHGAEVNKRNNNGASCVHFAAGDGSTEILSLFFDNGVDIALIGESGSPLHWAAAKGHFKALEYVHLLK